MDALNTIQVTPQTPSFSLYGMSRNSEMVGGEADAWASEGKSSKQTEVRKLEANLPYTAPTPLSERLTPTAKLPESHVDYLI